ncbi:Leucine-specific-binding protein [bioreactor metagenome]|jgi:ABC-type branched-chain amino acid transport systems, periplasmic component|uniref:Leucine-specific-binding protein n=1 Tax=bioreactor metagenome TaxID=1076179 RepID=A0A644V612_9ZZZZ|nr:ABC transporter substrate-binding protein [Acidaminococcaceae bacterium]
MKKGFLKLAAAGILVTLMALSVTGCGGKSEKDIKIGLLNEMTGGNATIGTAAANGAKMAIKEINAKGGVLGKQLKAVSADNKSEPAEAANAMTKLLMQDNVVAVTGTFSSSNAIAAASVAESAKKPYLIAGATNPKVTVDPKTKKVKKYIYRVCFIDPFQGTVAANFASNNLKATKAAMLIDNSSDYSKGLGEFFQAAFVKAGGTVVANEAYLQKDTDFKATLTKIKAQGADVLFVPGYYEEVGKIVKQAREMGLTMPIVGADGWDSPKLAEIAGEKALNNTFFTNHYSVDDPSEAGKAFVANYTKEFGQKPEALAVLGYDAVYVLVDAIKRANSTDADKIIAALSDTKNFKAVSGITTINASHDADKSAVIIEMKDGKQILNTSIKP